MIVVKIEVWPYGEEELAREADRIYIVNTGRGTKYFGEYDVLLPEHLPPVRRRNGGYEGAKRMRDWDRRKPIIALVERALAGITMTKEYTRHRGRTFKEGGHVPK